MLYFKIHIPSAVDVTANLEAIFEGAEVIPVYSAIFIPLSLSSGDM